VTTKRSAIADAFGLSRNTIAVALAMFKDPKFRREQTAGIAHVIAGICMSQKDDLVRIERGSALFDTTYEYFRKRRGR
jgi:hypothetical protein